MPWPDIAGLNHVREQHGVINRGDTLMPSCFKSSMSYFRFWPIFKTCGASKSGLQNLQRLVLGDLACQNAIAEQAIAFAAMEQRDITSHTWFQRHGHADEIACMASSESDSVSTQT